MLFNSNHNTINHNNYEEYFMLYVDNELTDDEKKMVDVFLTAHPHLQAEFDMLMGTRLLPETFSFDKSELFADNIKINMASEDLLLYIDGELPADKKKIVELELSGNTIYQQQYQLLLQTKLDATELISYPNKKELYKRTERVVVFKIWMRVAAAIIVIAAMGILYYQTNNSPAFTATTVSEVKPFASNPIQKQTTAEEKIMQQVANEKIAVNNQKSSNTLKNRYHKSRDESTLPEVAVINASKHIEQEHPSATATTAIAMNTNIEATTASFDPAQKIINKSAVTSALAMRNTINATEPSVPEPTVASNKESKGSIKSFLRKATRIIERKTGVDPTDGDNELLIGAVAVKLK